MYNNYTYIGIAVLALGVIFSSVFISTSGSIGFALLIFGALLIASGMFGKRKTTQAH